MIELDEAKAYVLSSVGPLESRDCAIEEARGCVVAQAVVATEAVPRFVNSSMDGFALRSSDTDDSPAVLRVVDSVYAGQVSALRLESGQAVRIMTGAPVPEGADCVCMIEEAVVDGDTVTIHRRLRPGDFLRQVGGDIAVGQVLFSPGDELNAVGIGVLAGQGLRRERVWPRPRVGVLSTGDELADAGAVLAGGQIRDLNRPLLLALLEESGCVAVDLGTAEDTREAITASLRHGVESCDAVVSTGGVSVGDVDYVKHVITELGAGTARSMQVAMKPGKPFAFGVVGSRRTPIFGRPGNPVSTRVSFEVFVRPALRTMAGHRCVNRLGMDAVLDAAIDKELDRKVHFVHVTVSWGPDQRLHVVDVTRRGSHLLHAVARANALAVVSDEAPRDAGDVVPVIVLDENSLGSPR